jgi:hypothetical protein
MRLAMLSICALSIVPATALAGGHDAPAYHDGKNTIAAIKAAKLPQRIERLLLRNANKILRHNPFNQPNDSKTWGHEIRATGEVGKYHEVTEPVIGKHKIYVRSPAVAKIRVSKNFSGGAAAFTMTHGEGRQDRVGNYLGREMEYAVYRNDKGQLIESLRYRKDGLHQKRRDFVVDADGKRTPVGTW